MASSSSVTMSALLVFCCFLLPPQGAAFCPARQIPTVPHQHHSLLFSASSSFSDSVQNATSNDLGIEDDVNSRMVHDFGVSEKTTAAQQASASDTTNSTISSSLSFSPSAILRFVTPTLALWMAPPIMSLIDTSVVGRYCGALDLAALGPGCTLIDSTAYLCMFIATAATNLVATAKANGQNQQAEQCVSEAFFLATICGLFLAGMVFTVGRVLLELIAGQASASVVPSALRYATVRAIAQPAVIVASVARASALAVQDTRGPLLSVALAFVLNAVGTTVLVKVAKMGIVGAAIGTLVADCAAAAFLLRRTYNQRKKNNSQVASVNGDVETNPASTSEHDENSMQMTTANGDDSDQVNGDIAMNGDTSTSNRPATTPLIVIPTWSNLTKFLRYAFPIFCTILGKSVVYNGISVSVGRLGSLSLAAHEVLLRSFFFWTPIGDSVGMTSQVFLPSILAQEERTGVPRPGAKRTLYTVGVLAGAIAATLAGLLPTKGSFLFTTHRQVISLLGLTAPILALGVGMHAIALTCEGMLLAQRDLKFLSGSYVATTIVTAGLLLSRFRPTTLGGYWWILALFQGSRALQFSVRNVFLSRRKTRRLQQAVE